MTDCSSEDPEVTQGTFAKVVRVGRGTRLPRLPAQNAPKKQWRFATQEVPLEHLDQHSTGETSGRSNYSSVAVLAVRVTEVLDDQARRGQGSALCRSGCAHFVFFFCFALVRVASWTSG